MFDNWPPETMIDGNFPVQKIARLTLVGVAV